MKESCTEQYVEMTFGQSGKVSQGDSYIPVRGMVRSEAA